MSVTDETLTSVRSNLSETIRPQDDLYRHVNGSWIESAEIPNDQSSTGAFIRLRDLVEERMKVIMDELSEGGEAPSADAQLAVDYYKSFMDEDAIEAAGTSALDPDLEVINSATTKDELATAVGALARTGVKVPFGWDVDTNLNDPNSYILFIGQSGLGLPDEAYYREEQHAQILAEYRLFVPRLLVAAGLVSDDDEAAATAERVIDFETALAKDHADVVWTRDADKINNPMAWDEFVASAPGFDWEAAREAAGLSADKVSELLVLTPDPLRGMATLWESTDIEVLREYLRWKVLTARAPYMGATIAQANFEFFGKALTGALQQRDRWKRGLALVTNVLGEALGQLYVSRHFPPEHKAKMQELVDDLLAAYGESIRSLDWMGEDTKKKALDKLATFNPKIGYPDKWRSFESLSIDSADLMANVRATESFEFDRSAAKLGQPMDRDEWYMAPQTVNAYYNPVWNEIVFPAAILQPPFFDPDADPAWNYGGIGAVIGHEIGHGFDDQGSKYDHTGKLQNWWTDEDRAEFEKRTGSLIEQYDAYTPAQLGDDSEHHVNGALTIGENIGDLGGITIGLNAYKIYLERNGMASLDDAPVIDGVTGTQRFFYSYARVWQNKARDEWVTLLLSIDPHSPAEFRCNGVVKNVDAFVDAFDVSEGDDLWLDPDKRVRIW